MKNLLINNEKIKDLIDLKIDNWNYPTSTNCYAYALGLDIPFNEISKHAYRVGCFSEDYLNKKNIDVYSLDIEDALLYDFYCLGLKGEEVDPNYNIKRNDNSFLISLFTGINDFHFLRKNKYDNLWYHKKGYISMPRNKDDDGAFIINPEDAFFIYYNYVKTYKLEYKSRR